MDEKELAEIKEMAMNYDGPIRGKILALVSVIETHRIELLQYENLRKNFNQLINDVLGEGYYNEGADVYTADEFSCRDLKAKASRKWYQRM